MTTNETTAVEVVDLSKDYGPVRAVKSVDLKIDSGEYFVLLGPSGGGKTTLLRLIGGFIKPSGGSVLLHGQDVSDHPPNRRPTSMVFQSYALFPHMSVARNVGYGLRIKRMPSSEVTGRVDRMLEMVGLEGYGDRMPHELSGGQQQRVQLARSLVLEADILLLDEPLAALDAKLRKDMCLELKHLQEKVGITFVHVTHNQEEAMTVADRIAVIADGELVEQGSAREIYENPVHRFTADFIGENNIFDGQVASSGPKGVRVDLGFATVELEPRGDAPDEGAAVSFSIRSELMKLLPRGRAQGSKGDRELETLPAEYLEELYLGLTTFHLVRLPDGREVQVRMISDGAKRSSFKAGADVRVAWRKADARLHLS